MNAADNILNRQYLGLEGTTNFKHRIVMVNNYLINLKSCFEKKDRLLIRQAHYEAFADIQKARDTVLKTYGVSSSFFNVKPEFVVKKLEEILAVLNHPSAAYQQRLLQKEILEE